MSELLMNSIALGYMGYSVVNFNMPKSFKEALRTLFNCPKCYAFWLTLIVMQDLKLSLIASLVAFLLDSFVVTKL